jgi:RHS repeat-associated protein
MGFTSLLGKTMAYDAAGRLSEANAVPPCPSGVNCAGQQTTLSRFNGWGQRFLRDTPNAQSVFSYGTEGFNLLSETTRNLSTSALSTTEHIWLPTASGPMPIAAVIDGVHYAVHADHLNTPRRLTDGAKAVKWQWPYSGFGEIGARATPAAGQATLNYSLRYPGQIDDGNGLFYNWHRFYDPRVGRYTKADPIGLDGGWNRFGYVGGIHWGLWIRRDCNDPLDQAMPGNAALTVDMARNDHLDSHQVMHGKTRQATLVKTVILCA